MTRPAPPILTVRHDESQRTFAAGHEVVIGRDAHADMRIVDPRISRAHLILRFDQGRWLAIDNGSLNGTYLNGYRMPVIDIHDGQSINVGNPQGPRLTFAIGPQQGQTSGRVRTRLSSDSGPATRAWSALPERTNPMQPSWPPQGQQGAHTRNPARSGPHVAPSRPMPPGQPSRPPNLPPRQPISPPRQAPSPMPPLVMPRRGAHPDQATVVNAGSAAPPAAEFTVINAKTADVSNLATRFVKLLSPRASSAAGTAGALAIGRAPENDIVVSDVLASRQHATLVPTPLGTEIRDNSINGTFVNGTRIGSAILTEDDVVTIGNVDLAFRDGTLTELSGAATRTGGLEVRNVRYVVDNGKQLLDDISLTARPGTLTAVIGGSGAGKSTLARLIAGYTTPSSGSVTFEGHNIHAEYASLRSRIGMVPQDDVVHHQLTVNQALGYAAELRLPPDTSKADRAKVVAQVLDELDLTKHADTRVDKLSGGQRKRASVALELLTGPSLLILDEPTSGLDPALDHQVMTMLRQLADAGRVVIVVTHMLSYLDTCDQLLLVAPGGKTAYCGPPDQIGDAMGTTNWAKIFTKVGADPDEANRRFLAQAEAQRRPPKLAAAKADEAEDLGEPVGGDRRAVGDGDGPACVVRRDGSGDRPARSGPTVLGDAGTLGLCRGGVDGGSAASGARFAAVPGPVLAAHVEDLAARHGHAGRIVAVLRRLCPVEDPAPPLIPARSRKGNAIHPPKHETFDLVARTNTDPKGMVRMVDEYVVKPWGLYLARPTPGRAQFHYLESWLLPSLGLRATVFHFNRGHERDHDYYLDVGEYTPGPDVWRSEDHYLDIEVRTGTGAELVDVDELLDAVRHGLLTPKVAAQAMRRAVGAVDGLASNGYDLCRWLAGKGMELTWRET